MPNSSYTHSELYVYLMVTKLLWVIIMSLPIVIIIAILIFILRSRSKEPYLEIEVSPSSKKDHDVKSSMEIYADGYDVSIIIDSIKVERKTSNNIDEIINELLKGE
mgnify:CR=1 FL=1